MKHSRVRLIHQLLPLALIAGYAICLTSAAGQEIEQDPLLRKHWEYPNTPAARARMASDPLAYRFRRALFGVAERARAVRAAIASGRMSHAAARASGMSTAVEGTYLFPVIVGAFAAPDSARPTDFNLADLNSRLWDQNYSDETHRNGSVRDFYEEVSYGRLHLSGDIYGYVQADNQVGHYVDQSGNEQSGFMDWLNQMIVTIDTSGSGVDFSKYDGDGDGFVDTLVLIHNLVGAEAQNIYSPTTGFWSHRWSYGGVNQYPSLGGVGFWRPYYTDDLDPNAPGNGNSSGVIMIDDYVMQPLLNYNHLLVSNPAQKMIDIGVFAHELGHAFGLPDFYDTDGGGSGGESEGLGHWCLMASGSWRRSYSPAHIGAWGKIYLGWVTPVVITDIDTMGIQIPSVENHEFILKIHTSQMDPREYFLIENRQPIGFDEHLHGGGGLLIYHINDQVTTSNRNPADLRWALEQADGFFHLENNKNRGDAGDPWPGSWNRTYFWYNNIPSSETRLKLDSYVEVVLKTGSGNTMTVDIIATPAFLLTDPDDGALLTDPTPNLTWQHYFPPADWGSVTYEVQLDTAKTFTTAQLDTTASAGITWNKPIIENRIYYWRVRAFDDLGHTRINSGGPRMLTVDATAPVLSLGALRNPLLPDQLDVFLISTEILTSYTVTVGGVPLTMSGVNAESAFILVGDYKLITTGTVSIHAEGCDAAGNSDSVDAELSVATVSSASITDLTSADGMLTVRIPAGAVMGDGLAVIFQRDDPERTFAGKILPYGLGGGSSRSSPISPLYWVDVPDQLPGRKVTVTIHWTPDLVRPGQMPTIWRQDGNRWVPLSTAVDLNSGLASAQVEKLGLLQLRTGGDQGISGSSTLSLEPAYPNPFNPVTRIAFTLPEPGPIRLVILNTRGQIVRILAEGAYPAGRHMVSWDGRDRGGRKVASGIYVYVLECRLGTRSKKMTLIR